MTPYRIERAIQFLLEQQAATEASLRKTRELINESWEKTQAQFQQVAKQNQTTTQQINSLSEQISTLSEQITALKDACRDLLEHAGYTDFRLNRLENPERR